MLVPPPAKGAMIRMQLFCVAVVSLGRSGASAPATLPGMIGRLAGGEAREGRDRRRVQEGRWYVVNPASVGACGLRVQYRLPPCLKSG